MEKLLNPYGNIFINSDKVFNYHMHTHTYYEMTLYEPFDGVVAINGKKFSVDSVIAVLICPSDFHEISVKNETKAEFIKIGFNADVLQREIPDFSSVMQNISKNEFITNVFREILSERENKEYVKLLINAAVYIILHKGKRVDAISITKGYKIAISAAKIINAEFNRNITLELTAKRLAVVPQYLSAVFKENLGINFSDYLSNIRLGYAAKLIEDTQKNFTEICYESGFGNFSHFSRSFKKKFGHSPREYKKHRKLL